MVLEGHKQDIECIATDGVSLVSACLNGQLKVWDNNTGELISHIDRKQYFCGDKYDDQSLEDDLSDYESGSPPSRDDTLPRIKRRINTDFSLAKHSPNSSLDSKSDFMRSYRHFYVEDKVRNRKSFGEVSRNWNSENSEGSLKNDKLTRELSDSGCNIGGKLSPVWCIDYVDNLVVIGCADGRLEFWEGTTGKLKVLSITPTNIYHSSFCLLQCVFEDGTESGISHLKIVGSKIVAARLCGNLDLFQLQTYNQGRPIDWNFTCAYRRTHVRTGSMGSITDRELKKEVTELQYQFLCVFHVSCKLFQTDLDEDFRCLKLITIKSHQQPITCLDCEGGRILSGSQDHMLKVHKLEDGSPLYSLHGHYGPITCLFIDRVNPTMSGSGSQDGMLCVWDLQTGKQQQNKPNNAYKLFIILPGTCMYNIQAHNGAITSMTYSSSYVISLGTDDRLCVWERFQGHLLNTINVPHAFSNHVLMLAPHLVVTGRNGGLVIWDVRSGECVRTIALGRSPFVFINQLIMLRDAVVCDYGTQLRIVRFPLITHKFE